MSSQPTSLQTIILDVSPLVWGERDIERAALDKKRSAEQKSSVGPAILPNVIESVVAFASSLLTIERDAGIIVICVADNRHAIVYPQRTEMQEWLQNPEIFTTNLQTLQSNLIQGVMNLLSNIGDNSHSSHSNHTCNHSQAAMAAAFSVALCTIHRFLVSARSGGTAARPDHFYQRQDESEGIVALMDHHSKQHSRRSKASSSSLWSPRILMIQASRDRSRDYNAFMNCTFAAMKQGIVLDACFLASSASASSAAGTKNDAGSENKSSSAFLEQACDLTGGLFLAPTGAAQVGGALTEVLLTVFLSPLHVRHRMNLPFNNKVDFRARCFETGKTVDLAVTCNQCLSIFSTKPKQQCPTCQATIHGKDVAVKRRHSSVGS